VHDWNLTGLPYLNSWTLMSEAFEASYKAVESELERYGATLAQLNMLLVLDHCEVPLTPGQIASYVFREQHSVSAQLSRMWRSGLVKKSRSKTDQRVVRIRITPKGKELLQKVKPSSLGLAQTILQDCLSETELKQFDKYMKKVRDSALKKLGREAKPIPPSFRIPKTPAECGV